MKQVYSIIFFVAMQSIITPVFADHFHVDRLSSKMQSDVISANVWNQSCPVSLDQLRIVSLSYYDLLGRVHHDGQLLVHQSAAKETLSVFKQLYVKKFPFSSIETLVTYHGDVQAAEEKNITYGFVCSHDQQNNMSPVSFGTVLTINPALNPVIHYVDDTVNSYIVVSPKSGMFSVNRHLKLKGMSDGIERLLNQRHFWRLSLKENQTGWKQFIFSKQIPVDRIAHTVLPVQHLPSVAAPFFNYEPLSPDIMKDLKKQGHWFEGCPVSRERLNLLTFSYHGFDGGVHTGKVIVLDVIAPFAIAALKELYHKQYPLEKSGIEGTVSLENTAGFNCRNMVGQKQYSLHAYGLAMDINVSRNPYVGAYKQSSDGQLIGTIVPASAGSLSYLNRSIKRPGMNEPIVSILKKYGFIQWGGDWQDTVDYMHFQMPMGIAKHLVLLDKKSAEQLMKLVIQYPEQAMYMSIDTRWDFLYKLYPDRYLTVLKKYFHLLKKQDESAVIHLVYNELVLSQ